MKRKSLVIRRVAFFAVAVTILAATVVGLYYLNDRMTVRYQAVGMVVDSNHQPIDGVEVVMLLSPPPPAGPALDVLFRQEGVKHGRQGASELKRKVGPPVGLSSQGGAYVVRAIGRTGAAQAIRLGFDSEGRPPFEVAWLVFRRPGEPDLTKTVSILGWRPSANGWGAFANRLPTVTLNRE